MSLLLNNSIPFLILKRHNTLFNYILIIYNLKAYNSMLIMHPNA